MVEGSYLSADKESVYSKALDDYASKGRERKGEHQ